MGEATAIALAGVSAGVLALAGPPLLARIGFRRQNFLGEPIVTAAGLAIALPAALLPLAVRPSDPHLRLSAGVTLAFALLGAIDDRWGGRAGGGFRGHLGALRAGRVTTGLVKLVGGGAVALAAAMALPPGEGSEALALAGRAAAIALAANAANLLDLRPLRTLKGVGLVALGAILVAPATRLPLGAMVAAAVAYAPFEARRRVMLGDAGANALGALVGFHVAAVAAPATLLAIGCALVLLHLYAEFASISAWIERHPLLARIDRWGWAPPAGQEPAPDTRKHSGG